MSAEAATVRCPAERCRAIFVVDERRLGRNVYCPDCGTRMTARPVELEARLLRRGREGAAGAGARLPRLPLIAVVDNVRSLWNVGAIFRTADACGMARLVLTGITGCPPRPEIEKTALGAERAVAWDYAADGQGALDALHAEGWTSVALETAAGARPLHEIDWPARVCLVVGNEVAGIAPGVLDACRERAAIPMRGAKDSLNVAVAFGIGAYAASTALAARHSR